MESTSSGGRKAESRCVVSDGESMAAEGSFCDACSPGVSVCRCVMTLNNKPGAMGGCAVGCQAEENREARKWSGLEAVELEKAGRAVGSPLCRVAFFFYGVGGAL